ncbi:hypothetical protein HTZ97_13695 [Desulfuromonas acetoxidans]|uniref:TraX family protein n=1 Tax=Desulfuromonas acetoxidans TaxID=891 RepID=UPI001593C678|nr:TraX family protein [Desulfuromonas acetoxidans]MBF0644876.1 hypothetical protein [Desulfuromonas acetoxidans]NVD25393.1 hypothetical protein [Desulfuromonas acetoxidans]NVE17506.1 hypothetical protein [Desulfuromonas acetoxidans]
MALEMRKNDRLKVLGLIIMVADHAALFLFEPLPWLYIVARFLGFPFFAYGVAQGALHTSRPLKYVLRLFFFGVVSQPLFYLATDELRLNICFTLFLGASSIILLKRFPAVGASFLSLSLLAAGSWFDPHVGYGWYGVALIVSFGFGSNVSLFFQLCASFWFNLHGDVQVFAVLSHLFIYTFPMPAIKLPRLVYYVAYPAHLGIIAFLRPFFC